MQRLGPDERRTGRLVQALRAALPTLALGLALGSCNDAPPRTPEVAAPTPLASYDGTGAAVQRISFCTRIPTDAVAAAVDEPGATRHYANGEQAPDTGDIAHEYGCIFDGETGLTAKAWVFAPPVTPDDAKRLAAEAGKVRGCRPLDPHEFGSPALGTLCRNRTETTVTYRGLFGDAWLSCSITAPAAAKPVDKALTDRAGAWCVQVATTAAS
jgi:hypothetical protein